MAAVKLAMRGTGADVGVATGTVKLATGGRDPTWASRLQTRRVS